MLTHNRFINYELRYYIDRINLQFFYISAQNLSLIKILKHYKYLSNFAKLIKHI